MTWTTSANPWSNAVHSDDVRTVSRPFAKLLFSEVNFKISVLPVVAGAHLVMLGVLAPVLAEPSTAALLVGSGLALVAAAVATNRKGAAGAVSEPQASCALMPSEDAAPAPSGDVIAPIDAIVRIETSAPSKANAHNQDWADLMARVSHELRTPLNAVLGFSDLMDRGLFGPLGHHRYQEYARHIHESGRELLKSAEDTLAVTSLLAAPARHAPTDIVDLAGLVADAWSFFGHLPSNRNVTLATTIPAGTEIVCDRRSMRQSLINLLSEALCRAASDTSIALDAAVDCGGVRVQLSVPSGSGSACRGPNSLHICLARTLLEFHGAPLDEQVTDGGGWRATTLLERASQPDFFAVAGGFRMPVAATPFA